MPKIEIDLQKMKHSPMWMMGLGGCAVVIVLLLGSVVSSAFAPRVETPTITATIQPTPTPTGTPLPTMAPTPEPSPTPSPQNLVWAPDTVGAYLRDSPNGTILALIPNGDSLEVSDQVEKMGGVFWYQVWYGGQSGWVVADYVHQFTNPSFLVVASEAGAYLRDAPQGQVLSWLSQGTPIEWVLQELDGDAFIWAQVELPDGSVGWVARFLLEGGDH